MPTHPSHNPNFRPLFPQSDPLTVSWLWPGWLPRGCLTLCGGRTTRAGKVICESSKLAMDLALRLIDGCLMPQETLTVSPDLPRRSNLQDPPRVLYLDAPGVASNLYWSIVDRLYLPGFFHFSSLDYRPLDLARPSQRQQLADLCALLRPHLLILDNLSSLCTANLEVPSEIMPVLDFLSLLAREWQMGMLILYPLRRRLSYKTRLRFVGLGDFSGSPLIPNLASVVLAQTFLPDSYIDLHQWPVMGSLFQVVKNNLSYTPQPLRFGINWGGSPRHEIVWSRFTP